MDDWNITSPPNTVTLFQLKQWLDIPQLPGVMKAKIERFLPEDPTSGAPSIVWQDRFSAALEDMNIRLRQEREERKNLASEVASLKRMVEEIHASLKAGRP